VAVWLATPLVMYTFILMPWSHATGFFLFALFLTVWVGGYGGAAILSAPERRSWALWALLGLVGGLMAITREQLALLLLLPAAEGLIAYVTILRERRWSDLRGLAGRHALFLGVFALTLSPQLAAYQALNGRPLPSATVGGKLVWCSPHFIDTLIDYDPRPSALCPIEGDISASFPPFAHGAFLWSPILVPALLGLAVLARHESDQPPTTNDQRPARSPHFDRSSFVVRRSSFVVRRKDGAALLAALLLLGFVAQTYINGAFGTTWHLTRSFGFRRLIECTPIFVLGLAALIDWLRARSSRALPLLAAALLIYWNIGLIAQWTIVRPQIRDGLIWEGMARYQFVEVPGAVLGKLDDVLFNRCRLAQNKTC
jgi:hypothetical protein